MVQSSNIRGVSIRQAIETITFDGQYSMGNLSTQTQHCALVNFMEVGTKSFIHAKKRGSQTLGSKSENTPHIFKRGKFKFIKTLTERNHLPWP